MNKEQFDILNELCIKLSDRDFYIVKFHEKDERIIQIKRESFYSTVKESEKSTKRNSSRFRVSAKYIAEQAELCKRFDEVVAEIGIGKKAEKYTALLKEQYAGVIDDRYFNHFALIKIIKVIKKRRTLTLEEAEKIVDEQLEKIYARRIKQGLPIQSYYYLT